MIELYRVLNSSGRYTNYDMISIDYDLDDIIPDDLYQYIVCSIGPSYMAWIPKDNSVLFWLKYSERISTDIEKIRFYDINDIRTFNYFFEVEVHNITPYGRKVIRNEN